MITLRPGSHVWRLLLLLAICGEYPYRSLHLLGSVRTLEELVRRLEVVQHFRTPAGADLGACKMLTTSGRGNRRTIRLYKSALFSCRPCTRQPSAGILPPPAVTAFPGV